MQLKLIHPQRESQAIMEHATRADVEVWAEHLKTDFLQCRELGHNWRPSTAKRVDTYFERTLRCPRCKTDRIEVLSLRGEILSKQYRYADGYLSGKLGRIVLDGRDALRLESITRSVERG